MAKSGTKGIVNSIWGNFWFKVFAVIVILLSALRLILALVAAFTIGLGAAIGRV